MSGRRVSDLPRDRAELLAQLARDVPDLTPEEFHRRLVEVMGSEEQADELLRRVDVQAREGL